MSASRVIFSRIRIISSRSTLRPPVRGGSFLYTEASGGFLTLRIAISTLPLSDPEPAA